MATGNNGSFNISTSNTYISGNVTWSETYDIAKNESVVKAELRLSRTNTGYETYASGVFYISINGNEISNSNVFSFTYNSNTLCVSHSVTVPHNADGSKSVEISARGELFGIDPGLTVSKQSKTVTLKTIPRASSLSVPNGTLGSTIRLTVNRASNSFTHTINWSAGGQSGSFTNVGAYVDWKNIPYEIANGNTSGNTVSCSFTIYTYSGGTRIGEATAKCTLTIPNNSTTKPTLSVSGITVTNSGDIDFWSEAIKGISKLKLSIDSSSSSSGKYGASIKSRKITTSDGQSTTSTSLEVTPKTSGTYKFSATVTDTRGFTSNVAEKTITVYDYAPPVISSVAVKRCDSTGNINDEGEYVSITAAYSYTKIDNRNNITSAIAKYKKSSEKTYTNLGNIENGTSVFGKFDIATSYDIQIIVTDAVGKSDTYTTTVGTADVEINVGVNKVGIGKYAEKDGYLEIGYDVDFEDPDQVRNAMGVGSGLTTKAEKAPNDDPNQITKTGFYSAQHANLASGSSGRSHILHIEGTGDYAIQFQYDYNEDVEAYRKKLAGVWGAWKRLGNEEIIPITKGGTEATNAIDARTNLGITPVNIGSIPMSGGSLDANAVYNTGYNYLQAGSNAPTGYGSLLTMAYRKNSGNTKTDYATQIFMPTGDSSTKPNSLFYRTSLASGWNAWHEVYGSNNMAWKKASVAFSNSVGTMSASGVTTSSTVLAVRGDSNVTGSYYSIGAADCNSNGTIKLAQANGSSQNATWIVSAWWSKSNSPDMT